MALVERNPPANAGDTRDTRDTGLIPGLGRSPGEGNGNPTPVFLSGKSHGQRSLSGYSPWTHKESDTTQRLTHTHTSSLEHGDNVPASQSFVFQDDLHGKAPGSRPSMEWVCNAVSFFLHSHEPSPIRFCSQVYCCIAETILLMFAFR